MDSRDYESMRETLLFYFKNGLGFSDDEIIEFLGERPTSEQFDCFMKIIKCLENTLTINGIKLWFRSRTRLLQGFTPAEILRLGDNSEKILTLANSFREGLYM